MTEVGELMPSPKIAMPGGPAEELYPTNCILAVLFPSVTSSSYSKPTIFPKP